MAITTKYIDTMAELFEFISDHPFDQEISRHRDHYLYRGLPDANYTLLTSLQRICKDKKTLLEPQILDNFAKYAELKDHTINDSVWRKMILGQHHGLPTRLLDWSRSPLIALHFATTEGDMDNLDRRDCVVWRLNVTKLHEKLPQKYQEVIDHAGHEIFSVKMIDSVCESLEQYDEDMGDSNMLIIEPPSMDERMMNQYSFFSLVPSGVNCVDDLFVHNTDAVVRYVISKNLRWQIRDFLDESNINERIIYPGLDGIATWIARHYFVRNAGRMHIEQKNISEMDVDVIVNAANEGLAPFGGVGINIFHAAGNEQLKKACREIGHCNVGCLAVTEGFNLKASHIFHAVGPHYNKAKEEENDQILRDLFEKCLQTLLNMEKHSIAFPLISTGAHHYPKQKVWKIALETCKDFMEKNTGYPLDISFCVLNVEDYLQGQKIYKRIMHIESDSQELLISNQRNRLRNNEYYERRR